MSSSKAGLADLKRLAREAAARASQAPDTSATPGQTGRPQHAPRAIDTPAASAQDLALFRRLAGDVAPVDTRNRILHSPAPVQPPAGPRKASPAPVQKRLANSTGVQTTGGPPADAGLSDGDVSHLLCEDGTAFVRQGVGPDVLKKLAQRFWRLEADLDLHGMTIDQARPRLATFIMQCVAYDARCVRIVHGKGYGSPDSRPILRDKVRAWLVGSSEVRAFAQAPERDGGAGATVVLLHIDDRRARDRRAP